MVGGGSRVKLKLVLLGQNPRPLLLQWLKYCGTAGREMPCYTKSSPMSIKAKVSIKCMFQLTTFLYI